MPSTSPHFRSAVKSIKSVSSSLMLFYERDVISGGEFSSEELDVLLKLNDTLLDSVCTIESVALRRLAQLPQD